ncbi:carbohydrate ABC transporter substrate-binding protein [Paenibacillus sp. HN-1]|uniref:ABC transporter substrate-binding protein n=1 Tax=Paenibacillus TaxID=44249 RepID=UPI001CA82C02|nr:MULTISPECIES: ABC transporter substrate-binding protein [Paenibacillus]MBY9077703.1 carbohydrate ABC transporter substrate-binding protein [Paenibacillus sp. CGMCC 1.18879]MBY9083718.1 carbohydrate ABC transporter substrate-binding protein [Paenibacillus sinensis]
MKKRRFLVLLLALVMILVTACGTSSTNTASSSENPAAGNTASPTATSSEAASGGSPLEEAYAGKYKGTTVTLFAKEIGEESVKFQDALKPFEEKTGITIEYEGNQSFESTLSVRVDGGNAPDIAKISQPGLLANFAKAGKVVDVSQFLNMDKLKDNYNQSWLDMATMDGPDGSPIMAGVWHQALAKSLVWYNKKEFEDAGYQIPQTYDELLALSDQMVSDGVAPWAIGIQSESSTGWVATDWIEDYLLRTTSLENYDKWTRGELPFSSPEVKKAVQMMLDIWTNPDYVNGGTKSIVSTTLSDATIPMFENPPKSMMYKMASLAVNYFPSDVNEDDYDFFYFPPIDEQYGKPVLVGGEIMAMFNDRPEVRAVMEYFTHGESLKGWIEQGGVVAPQKDASLDWYTNKVDRGVAEIIQNADSVRFDGSDLMPGEVGAGTFWKAMTDLVSGSVTLDEAMKEIDDSWPKQ